MGHRPDKISATEISLGRPRPQYHLPKLPQIYRSAIFNRADGRPPRASSRATGQAQRTLRVDFLLFRAKTRQIELLGFTPWNYIVLIV